MHSVNRCRKISISVHFGAMLMGFLICIGTSLEWGDNSVKLFSTRSSLQSHMEIIWAESWLRSGRAISSRGAGGSRCRSRAGSAISGRLCHGGMTVRGFAGVIFRTHEKFPGILKTASKNFFFFQRKLLKDFWFFLNENKVIFRRWQWLNKTSFKTYLQGFG